MSIVTYFVSRRKHGSTAQCLTIRKTACACLMLGLLSSAHVMAADGNTVSSAASTVYATNVVQQSTRTVKGAQWKFSGDKHKSLQVYIERIFHQQYPLVML